MVEIDRQRAQILERMSHLDPDLTSALRGVAEKIRPPNQEWVEWSGARFGPEARWDSRS